ncbi:hypothetical protein Cni_G07964 [Canna indica]|uniref:Uncharacterized protein n=1 Tax=Canna indica TaxID=4628 RepID=A0AAQ3JZS1_9LILI|nr:hypothetical protein Cni_G07964 [Canna indica]
MENSPSSGDGTTSATSAFVGSPSFAVASIDARPGDYAEVFGDLPGSCDIPFLDLPPALDGFCIASVQPRGSFSDFSEVFGGEDSGQPSASCEDLFISPKREEACSNERTTDEANFSHERIEELKLSPRHSYGSHITTEEGNQLSANSDLSDNVLKQFNLSYDKTSQEIEEVALSRETHISHLCVLPTLSLVVSDNLFQNIGGDDTHNMLNNGIGNRKHQSQSPDTSSCASKSSEYYLRADKKHTTNKYPVSENDNANASHHSCSSRSSMLSEEASSHDVKYTSSDISLPTQSMTEPPPARPSPKFFEKQGHREPSMTSSPKVGLDEVDFSSTVSASVAAIEEAMRLAQAKLEIAKKLMETKHDIRRKSRNLAHQEDIK